MIRNLAPLQEQPGRVKATCAVMLVTMLLASVWLGAWLLNTFN